MNPKTETIQPKKKNKPTCRQDTYVTVISKSGKLLEPTNRCGHVAYLLRTKKAIVVRKKPFTIRLLYDSPEYTQGEILGIDPGRTNIGLATVKDNGKCTGRYHLETRNREIKPLMSDRKKHRRKHRDYGRRDRRQRRAVKNNTCVEGHQIERVLPGCEKPIICREIRNKKARFSNRKRKKGRLHPTGNQLLETHIHAAEKISKIRPVKGIAIEINRFAFMELEAIQNGEDISNIDFQHGRLFGLKDKHEYIDREQDCKCLLCKKNKIAHYHHIEIRNDRGSDTVDNIAGLCAACHDRVHKEEGITKKLKAIKAGTKAKFAGTSVLNSVMPGIVKELAIRFPDIPIYLTNGSETKVFRTFCGLPKDHDTDAYCIACSALDITENDVDVSVNPECLKQFRRQDRQCVHAENVDRKYCADGKVVAVNRHKRTEQKTDSLEEYRRTHTKQDVSRLRVKAHPPTYRNRNRIMPGALMCYTVKNKEKEVISERFFILDRSRGRHNGKPDYYISTAGEKFPAGKCELIKRNTGIVFL